MTASPVTLSSYNDSKLKEKEANLMSLKPPFHADIVGSFLRPAWLKKARLAHEKGELSDEGLKEQEDRAITDLVAKEKQLGLSAFTDGEFRRSFWHLDFMAALTGSARVSSEHWSVHFKGKQPKSTTLAITGPLGFPDDHPFLSHFRFIKQFEDKNHMAKLTIPSPSMVHLIPCVRVDPDLPPVYQNNEDLFFEDLIKTYREALLAFL
jgi:5-methyltetrahydropteroyltriglutamate--homocysteine methyltransferase